MTNAGNQQQGQKQQQNVTAPDTDRRDSTNRFDREQRQDQSGSPLKDQPRRQDQSGSDRLEESNR